MTKATIIGVGSVGASIAFCLAVKELAEEIVLIDVNHEKAIGEALDIRQGLPFGAPVNIYAGTYEDAVNSNLVIVTAGVPRKPGQSRRDLAKTNVDIMLSIIPKITKVAPDAFYIMVANPVDVLTYAFMKKSGIPEERIIGTGTTLDTARLRAKLAEYYSIDPRDVQAVVMGEHGDSSFIPWSMAQISNVPIDRYNYSSSQFRGCCPPLKREEIADYVRKSGAMVISRKGATYYAITLATCHICECIMKNTNTALPVTSMMHGEYGIDNVALSTLSLVGSVGIRGNIICDLADEEIEALQKSAEALKSVIKGCDL